MTRERILERAGGDIRDDREERASGERGSVTGGMVGEGGLS